MKNKVKYSNEKYIGLGAVPIGIGALIKGWNIPEERYLDETCLPVVNFRAMTEACPHDCFHCFTDKKKRTLTFEQIKKIIDELEKEKTYTIDFVGEGEPTIDENLFEILEYVVAKKINVVIYTDVATKLNDKEFVKKLYDLGVSISPKCDSLFNSEYQNFVVGDKTNTYFDKRNSAIQNLIDFGFNKISQDGTTRMGFNMVISKKNFSEIEKTLRYCRDNNFWIMFSFYLPSGRSGAEDFDNSLDLSLDEKKGIVNLINSIDQEYGFKHNKWNNLLTTRCIEFIHIYGDGRVSPCAGNEKVFGNLLEEPLKIIKQRILNYYPNLHPLKFDGFCPYREKINEEVN